MSEFEDLQTFLKKRQDKKRLEKEWKKQPLINTFFKKIKKEDNGYEADDENSIRPNILTPTPVKCMDTSNVKNISSGKPCTSLTSASDKVFGSGPTLSAFAQVPGVSKCESRSLERDLQSPTYHIQHETTTMNTTVNTTNLNNVQRESHQEVGNGSITKIQPSSITACQPDMVKESCSPRKGIDEICQTYSVETVAQEAQTNESELSVKEVQTESTAMETSGVQTEIQTSTDHEVQTDINLSNIEEVGEN